MQNKFKTKSILATILPLVGFLFFGGISAESVSAYSASLTTSNDISLDAVMSEDGTSIHSESINVQTDCRAGYNLTIATPEGSDLYKYDNGTQSSNTASFTAVDGTSALNSNNNTNKWGYTLTTNPSGSTIFSPLSTTESILKTSSQTASPTSDINDTFNINYGVKVDRSMGVGSYKMANNGTVVYYLTMDTTCSEYTVAFNPNGGTGTIANQNIQTGEPTRLTAADAFKSPTGSSYTDAGNNTITGQAGKLWAFWGWNTAIDGSGDWYKDREEVQDLASAGSTITLYAQWKQATLSDMTSSPTPGPSDPKPINHDEMQDMRPEICYNSTAYSTDANSPAHIPYNASTNPGGYHTITLLDYRGKVTTGSSPEQPEQYTVSKLPDNLCWMTKDLNLGRTSGGANGDGTITLTSDDTDLADNTTFTLPVSPTTYTTGSAGYRTPQILINHTVSQYTVNSISYSPTTSYYSWAAATATNTSISTNGNIATSICPRNWDLPINTQYTNLRTRGSVTSATIAHAEPYNFIYGGYRNGANSYYNQTSTGYYWTSTSSSSSYAYRTYINSSGIYSSTATGYKYYGNKLRCVASSGTATVNYDANGGTGTMPSQNNAELNSTTVSTNSFTAPANSQFRNWNTRADGTGTTVTPGTSLLDIVSVGETITLYAQWDELYYIAFNANESSVGATPGSATGTMTNQTVTRGVATNIKTSTFALTGYIFLGWNTAADGTGTAYGDEQKVTNLTATGNTITLYAVWTNGAYLDTGQNVNQKLKRLAGNDSYYAQDTAISAIARSNTLPNDFTPSNENTISDSTSPFPIYAWYDSEDTTIYYYSEATTILMNKNSSNFFYQMRALSNLSTISTWDTAKVTNMSYMFYSTGYSATTFNLDLSSWNTASVTNMGGMFYYTGYSATTFNLDLSSWNTASVTDIHYMFREAGYSATTWSVGDLSDWDTTNVTDMSGMFEQAAYSVAAFVLDLSDWDTTNVTDMSSVFSLTGRSATTWSVGDLSDWDTTNVTDMASMFTAAGYSATTWSVGNLTGWNTTNVTDMSYMFYEAGYSATTWSVGDLSDWDTANVTNMYGMFEQAAYSVAAFVLDLSDWDTTNVTDMGGMFESAGWSATTWSVGDLSGWDIASVTNMSGTFIYAGYSATTWSVGDLSGWKTSSVTDMRGMFQGAGYSATTWSVGDLSGWNTANVTDMSQMFSDAGFRAASFILDLSSWNTSNVTDMALMFDGAGYFATNWSIGDLSDWDTSSVTDMRQMFHNAGAIASVFSVDLSSWNTSNVTDMSQMFQDAGRDATTWSVIISRTNNGTASGSIPNTTSNLYGESTSVTAVPPSGKSFTLAN